MTRNGCDSDEERQTTRDRPPAQTKFNDEKLPGKTTNSYRQVHKSDIEPCMCTYAPSPIYRLSADVFRSIFELCCQVESHVHFPLRISPPQLVVSQVCSAWRQIMLDIPTFWNKITIAFYNCTRYDRMVEVPRIWLSRAKDFPCFIHVGFLPPLVSHNTLWLHNINKSIVQELISPHKFKGLGVTFADSHLHDLLQLSDEKLSCIEVLRLRYVHDDNNREIVSQSPLDFHKLSNLTSFSLFRAFSLFGPTIPRRECRYFDMFSGIPWHRLCHIHLGVELPALRCLNILETSSSVLETCLLVVSEDLSFVSSPPSQIKPVHCPQLRELKVYIYPNIMLDDGNSFLLCLRLPKLRSLTFDCPDNSPVAIDPQILFRMQSVCTMRLEELIISDSGCDVDAGALLAGMPSLRCLELPKQSMFTSGAIRKLGAGSIGPFLEELTIKNPKISNKIGQLIQMVKTRSCIGKETSAHNTTMPTPFRSVVLYCEDPDEELLQEYKAAIDEINRSGVKLTVNYLDYVEE